MKVVAAQQAAVEPSSSSDVSTSTMLSPPPTTCTSPSSGPSRPSNYLNLNSDNDDDGSPSIDSPEESVPSANLLLLEEQSHGAAPSDSQDKTSNSTVPVSRPVRPSYSSATATPATIVPPVVLVDTPTTTLGSSSRDKLKPSDLLAASYTVQAPSNSTEEPSLTPLLPAPIAKTVSGVTFLSRLSLRVLHVLTRNSLEAMKSGACAGLHVGRDVLIGTLWSTSRLLALLQQQPTHYQRRITEHSHNNPASNSVGKETANTVVSDSMEGQAQGINFFAAMSIYLVHRSFSFAEMLTTTGFDFTSSLASASFVTAEETVRMMDGIFGSTDTSHAVAQFFAVVRRQWGEACRDPAFKQMGNLEMIKAIAAFVYIQQTTRNRRIRNAATHCLFSMTAPPGCVYVERMDRPINVEEKLKILLANSEPEQDASDDHTPIDCPITDRYTRHIQWEVDMEAMPAMKPYHRSKEHLLRGMTRYIRYATAAYGRLFMQILGIATYAAPDPHSGICRDKNGRVHPADHVIFAQHVGLPLDAILDSTASSATINNAGLAANEHYPFHNMKPSGLHIPNFYLAVDHQSQNLIITLRGTLGLSDFLTNLACEYTTIWVNETACRVHAGMFAQARTLARPMGRLHGAVRNGLAMWPDYGLVIVGHSLGGGVAALLGLLWSSVKLVREEGEDGTNTGDSLPLMGTFLTSSGSKLPPNRPIHVYSYGTPCVSTELLSNALKGLVTTVVHGEDFVASLSLGVLHDLRQAVVNLNETTTTTGEPAGKGTEQVLKRMLNKSKLPELLPSSSARPAGGGREQRANRLRWAPTSFGFPITSAIEMLADAEDIVGTGSKLAVPPSPLHVITSTHSSSSQRSASNTRSESSESNHSNRSELADEEDDDWLWSMRTALSADMQNEKLYAPGTVYWLRSQKCSVPPSNAPTSHSSTSSGTSSHSSLWESDTTTLTWLPTRTVKLVQVDRVEQVFSEVAFTRSMLLDHLPARYEWCLKALSHECLPKKV